MTAQEYLSRAYRMEQQVESKLQQIEALRSMAESLTSCIGTEPVAHTRNVTSMQDTVNKIIEEEQELNAQIDRLVEIKKEIADTIARVTNVTYRLILEKRHLCFQMWEQIAYDMNYSIRSVQTKYGEALKVVEKILGEIPDEE